MISSRPCPFVLQAPTVTDNSEDPAPDASLEERLAKKAAGMKLSPGNERPVIISNLVSSDEKDKETKLQWVHLVMAGQRPIMRIGGGMLGIAHVGFVRVLELAGIRFLGLGGTSAGAINAALIATVRENPACESWKEVKEVMESCEFDTFEDGDGFFKKLRKKLVKSFSMLAVIRTVLTHPWQVSKAWRNMGIHHGTTFHDWLADCMEKYGIKDSEQLRQRMQLSAHGVRITSKVDKQDVTEALDKAMQKREYYPLRLVTSELTTQTMVVLPRDADLFYADEDSAPPADFVRASMSVPYFFKPFQLPHQRAGVQWGQLLDVGRTSETWKLRNGFTGEVPDSAVFCDGGTLSNFPMGLFYEHPVEGAPTLGITLGPDRASAQKIKSMKEFVSSMNNTSRHLLDREFLFHNPGYRDWVATVDTSRFNWLEFEMTENRRKQLFLQGMDAGVKFLEKFRAPSSHILDDYMLTRKLQSTAWKVQEGTLSDAARNHLNAVILEEKYNREAAPAIEELQKWQQRLGDKWAEGVFFPDVTEQERKAVLVHRRTLQTFWRGVQAAYKPNPGSGQAVLPDGWWTRNWTGRGRQYRLLVEPLDIANWYYTNNHTKSGHYIDNIGNSLEDELNTDNHKRPERYLMLQQREAAVFGKEGMVSSLVKARDLKQNVGSMTWEQYVGSLQQQQQQLPTGLVDEARPQPPATPVP